MKYIVAVILASLVMILIIVCIVIDRPVDRFFWSFRQYEHDLTALQNDTVVHDALFYSPLTRDNSKIPSSDTVRQHLAIYLTPATPTVWLIGPVGSFWVVNSPNSGSFNIPASAVLFDIQDHHNAPNVSVLMQWDQHTTIMRPVYDDGGVRVGEIGFVLSPGVDVDQNIWNRTTSPLQWFTVSQ